ncbi:hypothetical protein HCN44_005700 [Aphidius gifuensis]|uniref:Cyclin E n=1 Tax=Aphidius gifuensis TaxID=684658 RepID=A0A834XXE4_APHGI|nr:G1/S-specific cyclin-E-like [Aphidius gifuensis]KAF7992919.1 hypothetical protein HCN44_005700 [Aphidius gifuensis]
MPQTSLQEKHQSHSYLQAMKLSQSSKRKRKNTEPCEDSENIYPPKKITIGSNNVADTPKTPQSNIITSSSSSTSSSLFKEQREPSTWTELRTATCFLTPSSSSNKTCPLPSFPWADGSQVWSVMCTGDQKTLTQRDPLMFQRHPTLQPRMRAILLDWLIEVSEVYKLHRETYYLAMDYIDRYLSTHQNVPKNQLQLIGITCLFIAAKVEEIYPPKLSEFAYVTDGACTEEEILGKELIVLKGLGWNLSPVTPPGWLNVFMQIESGDWSRPNAFIYPQYSGLQYSQTAQILDLATLDEGSLKYPYSHMAAAAIYHTLGRECSLRVSRLTWEQLSPCVKWLASFANTVADEGQQLLLRTAIPSVEINSGSGLRAAVPNIVLDETHRIQTHVVDLKMLEKAQTRLINNDSIDNNSSLDITDSPDKSGILTPPSSSQKNSPSPPRLPPQLEPYT